jgi:hypothetical protein
MKFPRQSLLTETQAFQPVRPADTLSAPRISGLETRWAHRLEICVPLSRLGLHFCGYGKTERARPFSFAQSAYRPAGKIESSRQTAATLTNAN